ncbi:peptidase inhibitor family I36 protein [Nonomuraea longicatena]|uniref:Peptidase inhibitor family I36 n=1 Tax=Nonomuraea longicatena TaxID=83682 RepID=A0ABN1PX54_9ACTN
MRKIALAVGSLSLGVMGFAGLGSAAQAASTSPALPVEEVAYERLDVIDPLRDRCTDKFCLYEHDEFTGGKITITLPPAGRCGNIPSAYRNWASSQKNEYDRSVWLYDALNCSGSPGYTARANSQDKDLTDNGFDNKASSLAS